MESVGPYELLDPLGRGGMGSVFRARDPRSGDEVALKLLSAGRGASALQRRRLKQEAHALLKVQHPNVVQLREVGEHEGAPYLVLDYHPLGSLAEAMRRGPLDPDDAARVGLQLAAGLSAAHAVGVLHRDIKPGNVLLSADGEALLTDFGLAKDLEQVGDATRLTQTGALQGTPGYWAPEQAAGQLDVVGPATDVYGLGAVIYFALTGRPPIDGETFMELVSATRALAPPSVRSLRPEVPRALEAIVERCLEKDPQARFGAAADVEAALLGYLAGEGGSPWRRVLPAAAALLVGVGLAAFVLAKGGEPPASASPPPPAPEVVTSPAPTTEAPPAAEPTGPPEWYAALTSGRRPPLPLPQGIVWGEEPGDYRNERDGTLLRWVPAGSFDMGEENGEADERPVRRVTFARGFFMGKLEVTWGQFRRFCEETERKAPGNVIDRTQDGGERFEAPDDHPVFNATWEEAVAYCKWAGLRLPSEAEWEYAARGDDPTRRFPWGDVTDATRLNQLDASAPWVLPEHSAKRGISKATFDDGFPYTAPVGSFPAGASWVGCQDLAGNVSEWVRDAYAKSYEGAPVDGSAREPDGSTRRVLRARRGGSWGNAAHVCRIANRKAYSETSRSRNVGFRAARSLP